MVRGAPKLEDSRPLQPAAQSPQLLGARVCLLEADFRLVDCAGILHTARKRDPQRWLEAVVAYSAPALRAKSDRAREISNYPDDDVPGKSARFNERWARLREFVSHVLAGEVRDPCPKATHFGGTMDVPHGRMIPAKCAAGTANTFYAIARRS